MFTMPAFRRTRNVFLIALLTFEIFEAALVTEERSMAGTETEDSKKISWICDAPKDIIVKVIAMMTEKRTEEEFARGRTLRNWFYFIGQRKGGDETSGGIYLCESGYR